MRPIVIVLVSAVFVNVSHSQSLTPVQRLSLEDRQLGGSPSNPLHPEANWDRAASAPLDSFFMAAMDAYGIPGLAACLVKKDRLLWQGYYGYADLPRGTPISDSTIFMLASVSKTVTAAALMQLYEDGRFHLDDDIGNVLPFGVRNPNHPTTSINFWMLLTHTSSLLDNQSILNSTYCLGDHPMGLGTFLREYLVPGGQYYNAQANFSSAMPGTKYRYSNYGAALCGYLVEVLTGIPFDRYCRDSIFLPLDMARTSWFLKDLDTTFIARPYTYESGSYIDHGLYGYPDYPGGQLRTTIPSLARFLLANMNGGEFQGSRILDTSTVRLMRTVSFTVISGQFELGLMWRKVMVDGRPLWGHTGSDRGVTTAMFLSETDSTGAIFLSNFSMDSFPFEAIVDRLMDEADSLTVSVSDPLAWMPGGVQLEQNYPNPFNPNTTIKYELPKQAHVVLAVFNTLGQKVTTLLDEVVKAGYHEAQFDASDLASGVYLYRLTAGDVIQTRKMILVR